MSWRLKKKQRNKKPASVYVLRFVWWWARFKATAEAVLCPLWHYRGCGWANTTSSRHHSNTCSLDATSNFGFSCLTELQDKLYIVPITCFWSSTSAAEMVLKAAKTSFKNPGQKGHPYLDSNIFPDKWMKQGQTQRFCSWAENENSHPTIC